MRSYVAAAFPAAHDGAICIDQSCESLDAEAEGATRALALVMSALRRHDFRVRRVNAFMDSGRTTMIDHTGIGVAEVRRSANFYDAALACSACAECCRCRTTWGPMASATASSI